MGIETKTCTEVKCDGCGDGWQDGEYGMPHYESAESALADVLKPDDDGGLGWSQTDDGLLCKSCSEKRQCRLEGHEWNPWRACLCGGRIAAHTTATEVRYCDRCGNASEQRTADGGTGPCAAPAPPMELSRGARLVEHLRNHNLFIEQRPALASYPPPDVPAGVEDLVQQGAALAAQIDAALPDDFHVR